jgi:hypothetical protein
MINSKQSAHVSISASLQHNDLYWRSHCLHYFVINFITIVYVCTSLFKYVLPNACYICRRSRYYTIEFQLILTTVMQSVEAFAGCSRYKRFICNYKVKGAVANFMYEFLNCFWVQRIDTKTSTMISGTPVKNRTLDLPYILVGGC